MRTMILIAVLISAGCQTSTVGTGIAVGAGAVVSLDLCDEVDYKRRGSEVQIFAKCRAPLR